MNEKVKQAVSYLKRVNQEWAKAIATSAIRGFSYERLTNDFKIVETALANCEKEKIELIAEQHRLFDLAKEQENELDDLREFAKVLCKMKIVDSNHKIYGINENDIALIKKVVEKYGKKIN